MVVEPREKVGMTRTENSMESGPKKMGRPRDPGLDSRILATAIELFIRAGWRDFSMDEIARRAQVGKATLYLRWKSREDLLHDALSQAFAPWDIRPSCSFRHDLETLVAAIVCELSLDIGWAINRAQTELTLPPKLRAHCQQLVAARLAVISGLIANARSKGEISEKVPDELIIDAVTGAAVSRAARAALAGGQVSGEEASDYAKRLVGFLYTAFIGG
jgi:AcrR family transcriptional regulator